VGECRAFDVQDILVQVFCRAEHSRASPDVVTGRDGLSLPRATSCGGSPISILPLESSYIQDAKFLLIESDSVMKSLQQIFLPLNIPFDNSKYKFSRIVAETLA